MLLRAIARPLVAVGFIADGYDAVRHPAAHLSTARAGLTQVTQAAERLPNAVQSAVPSSSELDDPTLTRAIRIHGAATIAAATCLALGKAPRLAGLILAGLSAPLVVANEPFSKNAALPRAQRRAVFIRKLAAVGTALLIAADTAGKPSIRWRASNAVSQHQKQTAHAKKSK